MRAVVGVTDNAWAAFLQERPTVSEANFLMPSGPASFGSASPGEPFLFKTHWPDNQLVDGGFVSGYGRFTVAEAWHLFGEGNGVARMRSWPRRSAATAEHRQTRNATIGCLLLRDLFFVPEGQTMDGPDDFAKNIVKYKGYDLATSGRHVDVMFETMLSRAELRIGGDEPELPAVVPGPVFGRDLLVRARVGQRAFHGLVLTSYERRCAITGNHIRPTLQAATFALSRRRASTASTTGCSFVLTSTPCSTSATWASTNATS